ncbi:hypothetical protein QN277_011953 [Acacia crassicarpa]|uniref:Uncharacterized protein n=1 Tax=Acacia crassicarpa TaxID=499986 RepID=A0AAE1MZR1_9FABA|nr:hypothetical protein QN277_011953 [Acacia crassicarpa]
MTKISLRFVSIIFVVSILLLHPHTCSASSLSRRQNTSPTNNTVSAAAATTTCDSDHRCLITDVVDADSFGSDPRFVSTLASTGPPGSIAFNTLNLNKPAVACRSPTGRFSTCLPRKTVAPANAPVCMNPYKRDC